MSKFLMPFRNLFLKKVPFYVLTLSLLTSIAAFYFFTSMSNPQSVIAPVAVAQNTGCISSMNIVRLKDFSLTRPILLADVSCQSDGLEETKAAMIDVIHQQKQFGNISSSSIYLRKITDGSWCTINGEEEYIAGSLMKIPILITFLKQVENQPALLDKQLLFTGHNAELPTQNFVEDNLISGVKYKIRDLLSRMIINSDNDALTLLNQEINVIRFKKLFADLNLREPYMDQKSYVITAPDCAKFLRILYNASYLNQEMSEFALDLLTQSKFKKGFVKGIPADVKVAHKFGESGTTGRDVQLHEEGIVYVSNNPYLLLIMTKGRDFDKMAESISAISNTVYSKFSGTILN